MGFKEFLIEQEDTKIGIVVYHPNDIEHMDFQVFAWPDTDNTVANQWRKLDNAIPNDDDAAHAHFYAHLQTKSKPQEKDGEVVFGPFDHIDELL